VNETRMMLAKGTRHDMFAHGCLSVRMNTPTEHCQIYSNKMRLRTVYYISVNCFTCFG